MSREKKYKTDEEKKAAKKKYLKQYYQNNKEKILKHASDYYQNNKEKKLEYQKEYYQNNKEHILEYQSDYYQDNKDKIDEYHTEYQHEYRLTPKGRANSLLSGYKQSDKEKNRGECTLTDNWIVDNVFNGQCCHYCGESEWTKLGVDRKDSSLPHTPDNCVSCCKACNDKKGATPYDQYMRMIGKIA